ncbi:MAG TPA: Gmad2 immunoglobulin-like domain-containing protein [Candidatus Paceibacterota bacterium]|nr:Gmad2 immunoglobulin-like domain-containing protein [Candidatus Paceibacterota bacterium]
MQKNAFLIIAIILIVILGGFYFFSSREQQIACTLEAKICPDGSSVGRVAPNCDFAPCPGEKEGILISSPKRNETIKSPLIIEGEAKGFWFFEAQFTAELYDAQGNFLGRAILTAQKNWMSEDFVPFEGNLIFTQPQSPTGVLKFLSSNPSGLKENQKVFEVPVQFELIPTQKILLYYYNPEKDKDETGNIKCSKDGLIAIEREIPITQTPIKDTLNLLLKGKQNLTQEDIDKGITTEYPLEGFKLKSVNLKSDGTLILEFEDPFNKTIGGSCRVGILWSQIEATAKQFPEVKQVKFLPEELFQP